MGIGATRQKLSHTADVTSEIRSAYAWPMCMRQDTTDFRLDVNELISMLDYFPINRRDYLVLSFISCEYLPLGKVWYDCVIASGMNHILIGAIDEPSYVALKTHGIPTFRVYTPSFFADHLDYINPGGFGGKALSLIFLRYTIVKCLIDQGVNVLLCDIDAMLLKNPVHALQNVDIAFQRVVYFPVEIARMWGFALCAGFVACKANAAVSALLSEVILIQKEVSSDQLAWNIALMKSKITWDAQFPHSTDTEQLKVHFLHYANQEVQGVNKESSLSLLALPATQFWRHEFVPFDAPMCIVAHPNSQKMLGNKLQSFRDLIAKCNISSSCGLHRLDKSLSLVFE